MNDELSARAVTDVLATTWLGRPYTYIPETGSTNDDLKRLAAAGAPHGAVLLAEYQSAGRGRLDRRWEASPGTSLLFSVLLRPAGWPVERGGWLTMLTALAAAEAVEAVAGLRASLKWPNDVMVGERKTGGLLLDTTLDTRGRLETAVVGVGLNVNIPAEQLPDAVTPATSLFVAGGRPVARRALLVDLLARLERHYDAAAAGNSPVAAWAARLATLGRAVRVTQGSAEPLLGTAEATDEWGRLLLRDAAGRLHTVAAGDVSLRDR